ncbi:MAG: ABC transporter permease [bacterium]
MQSISKLTELAYIYKARITHLNLPLHIAKRLATGKKKAFSSFIMRISIIATTISVAAMIVSLSFINGFQKVVAEKVFGFWGHVRIQHYEPVKSVMAEESPITKDVDTEKKLKAESNVSSISPFATRSAILNANGTLEGILLKGVSGDYPFKKIQRFLLRGKWPSLADSNKRNEIVLSAYTADQLSIDTGKYLLIYFIQDQGELPRTRKLKVSGIYKTGIDVYDKVYAIGDLRLIQQLNSWDTNQIGGYELDLVNKAMMEETASSIFNYLPTGWNAITLKDLSPEIFDWLSLQNTNKYILIIVMTIVAIINLITCLIILLLERTGMIALLKSLGAKDGMIQKIFIYYGGWIAGLGISAGTIIGLALCYLQQYGEFIRLNEEAYYVRTAPVEINYLQVLMVAGGTFLISLLILILPSLISRKINPSKALRFK